jgi:hypothetical protein
MLRFRTDGSEGEVYATGLRNSVGFDWQPGTGDLYATDNGRDLLGDDFPPCELNRVERGGFYGWPIANDNRVADPDLGAGNEERVEHSIPPAHPFRAHNAPLGIVFLRHPSHGSTWRGAALVALHGSWNRTVKDGYKVVSLHWGKDGSIEERDFAVGFEVEGDVIGRPVDVAEASDGTIYISDDYAGAIYRVDLGDASAPVTPREPSRATETRPGAAGRPAEGASLWQEHACARCHDAARAEPGVVSVPLSALATRYDAAGLSDFLAAPTPPMPLFPLDEAERRDLAAFLLEAYE